MLQRNAVLAERSKSDSVDDRSDATASTLSSPGLLSDSLRLPWLFPLYPARLIRICHPGSHESAIQAQTSRKRRPPYTWACVHAGNVTRHKSIGV